MSATELYPSASAEPVIGIDDRSENKIHYQNGMNTSNKNLQGLTTCFTDKNKNFSVFRSIDTNTFIATISTSVTLFVN